MKISVLLARSTYQLEHVSFGTALASSLTDFVKGGAEDQTCGELPE